MRNALLLTFFIFIACQTKNKGFRCGTVLPKHGIDGAIVEFNRVAMMDTITSVLTGKLVSIEINEALPGGVVELLKDSIRFTGVSDMEGQFAFKHIPSGTYQLQCQYVGHRNYTSDTFTLISGGIYKVIIGLGSKGQDDY